MQFDPLGSTSTAASPTTPTAAVPTPAAAPSAGSTAPVVAVDNAVAGSVSVSVAVPAAAPAATPVNVDVNAVTRRDLSANSGRAPHYADEFQVYHKAKNNGNGTSKRASCHHCSGDWAYNETRLKNHIIDAYRGCRKIPQATRERIRAAHARTSRPSLTSPPPPMPIGVVPPMPTTPAVAVPVVGPPDDQGGTANNNTNISMADDGNANVNGNGSDLPPPTKRKRESLVATATDPACPAGPGAQLRVSVEFSVIDGGLLRAQWIVAEMIQEFHRDVIVVSLVPSQSDNVFNIWIGGKIVWSRGPGQPLPDFEHLRPLVRAHVLAPPSS